MSKNQDYPADRTERLIPLARDAFGDDVTLYGDSNSSYDVKNAVRIGRMMEAHDYAFYEEPCPFDHLWETKQVADRLKIPIAGGEQEFSMRRFRWTIENRAVDIVQPDLHYFGGFLRCQEIAKLAATAGMPCTVHMSGAGLGYLYVLHFASMVDRPGEFQEYKGQSRVPVQCVTSSLTCEDGKMKVPTGPGFGITIDKSWLAGCELVSSSS